MKFKLKNIKPNPFRHIEHYPIQKEKVAALRESIKSTNFWDNIVARQLNGTAEIAYGHHRLEALRAEYGPNHEVDFIIRDLDDATMIQVMARENMEEWGTSAWVEMETIRAVVEAFAEGKIKLPKIKVGGEGSIGKFRCAPSFQKRTKDAFSHLENAYNAQTIAEFIGWVQPGTGQADGKVHVALNALELIEKGILNESDFTGLNGKQALTLVTETQQTEKFRAAEEKMHRERAEKAETEHVRRSETAKAEKAKRAIKADAKAVGKKISKAIKSGEIGYKEAKKVKHEVIGKSKKDDPEMNKFAYALANDVDKLLCTDKLEKELKAICEAKDYLLGSVSRKLISSLERLSTRALKFAAKLGADTSSAHSQKLLTR